GDIGQEESRDPPATTHRDIMDIASTRGSVVRTAVDPTIDSVDSKVLVRRRVAAPHLQATHGVRF
ncbi:MAG: hypothetical protein ACNA8P_03250, partial [Phycisphaerales bacterium]